MKLRAYQKYYYTVDVYDYTETTNVNGDIVRQYDYLDTRNIDITTDNTNKIIIRAELPITKNYQLRNLKDRGGNDVQPGYWWFVSSVEPVINALGFIEGYKMKTGAATLT
jgi:hypothetical protein